jgi:spore coat polysaccharide biosynthesis predicted glycosyltransferase SpsG
MSNLPRIDILCDGNEKIGFGHVRRSQALAAQLVRDGVIVRVMSSALQSSAMLPVMSLDDSVSAVTIFDTPLDIDEKLNMLASLGRLTVALDYFGNALPDINIAVFAHQVVRAKHYACVGFEYILIRDEIFNMRARACSGRTDRVMIMVGGGDILGQGPRAAEVLVRAGCRVTLIQGPYAASSQQCSDYEVCTNPSNLPEIFAACDWAVTSGGGALFEGLCLGKAVHVLPQTDAEERVARHVYSEGGVLGVGLESLRAYNLNEIVNKGSNGVHLVDGLGAQRVSKIVRSRL